jgi:hypothetical protein
MLQVDWAQLGVAEGGSGGHLFSDNGHSHTDRALIWGFPFRTWAIRILLVFIVYTVPASVYVFILNGAVIIVHRAVAT